MWTEEEPDEPAPGLLGRLTDSGRIGGHGPAPAPTDSEDQADG